MELTKVRFVFKLLSTSSAYTTLVFHIHIILSTLPVLSELSVGWNSIFDQRLYGTNRF